MIKFNNLCDELSFFVNELDKELRFINCEKDVFVNLSKIDNGLKISYDGANWDISYANLSCFSRALSLLKSKINKNDFDTTIETPEYNNLGLMADCSRNGVINVNTTKKLIRHMALMGYNMLQLYTEDTYELEGQPYFGYMRGAYTKKELIELDKYASAFGIELVPCIQALAHLGASLRWEAFNDIKDIEDILLVKNEKTYEFIEQMIKHCRETFTTDQINIGMDEAHMLGLGKYLIQNGYENRLEIMIYHLNRVNQICKKYNFKPMMWSDMFFRLLSPDSDYETDKDFSEVKEFKLLPDDIKIIYWNYYSVDKKIYDSMFKQHLKLKNETWFAGGAWRWRGFAPDNHYSFHVSDLALQSCKEHGIKNVLVTAWGDNGSECSQLSILPTLQFFAEASFSKNTTMEHLAERFLVCTNGILSDFMLLDMPNHTSDNPVPGGCSINPQKYLFYQDVLLGLFDKHVIKDDYNNHYENLAIEIEKAKARNPEWEYLFDVVEKLCVVLSRKAEIGVSLKEAYDNNDKETLNNLCDDLNQISKDVLTMRTAFKKQWLIENKASGLEVIDIRFGGMVTRLDTAQERIKQFINGEITEIEELTYERQFFDCRGDEERRNSLPVSEWLLMASPNRIGRT